MSINPTADHPQPDATAVTHESIAAALRKTPDAKILPPTEEQRRVIEAEPTPSLVVAGAGSGKTHTMVLRMLWLIAHHGVAPSSLLGLTFTRKAAGELRERIDDGLRRLRAAGLIEGDDADLPEVSTYNAFAHRVFQEHALLIGREPDSVLLDEAGAFGLMRGIVLRSDDDELADFDVTVSSVTTRALELARGMRENRVDPADLDGVVRAFAAIRELPGKTGKPHSPPLKGTLDDTSELVRLNAYARLAEAYERTKRERGLIEFTDQIVGALEICERAPQVVEALRERHRHVILDEYQDTSVGQTALFSTMFRGHSIMAVGDPKQSIYGWRGASAANMRRFHDDFGARRDATFTLSTSWRNDARILELANLIATPLSIAEQPPLPELAPRPGAGDGCIEASVHQSVDEEYRAVADWIAEAFAGPDGVGPDGRLIGIRADAPSAAILFRRRRDMARVARLLTDRGVPARVIGLGGLLTTPEITDLAAVLRAARDPRAGSDLIRLLVGARARLGPADVAALHGLARSMRARGIADSGIAPGDHGPELEVTLADALEFVASKQPDGTGIGRISPAGHERLVGLGTMLADVRAHLGLPLVEAVEYAITRAGIDLEARANPTRREAADNLDAFIDYVVGYSAAHPSGDIGALLDWLDVAASRDDLAGAPIEPEPGAVQLLTIHGAKGLEWDLVAVPELIEGGLPKASREGAGWFKGGKLPYPLRLDHADLPGFDLDGYASHSEVNAAITTLTAEVKERFLEEERRLAYVAFTRARSRLLLTASYWGSGKKPRALSPYLREAVDAGLIPEPPAQTDEERPASLDRTETVSWPRPAFRGTDAEAMRDLAELVRAGLAESDLPPTSWDRDIDLLLREREDRARATPIVMPQRLAASHFKDLVLNPETVGAQWRRALPQRPFRQTRLGTMFHAWVESRFDAPAGGGDLLDDDALGIEPEDLEGLGLVAPSTADAERLAHLQARFERSAWATRRPIAVEQSIEVALGGRTLVCKLDAVYRRDDGIIEVVDWKTGSAPRGAAAEWERQLQLALYTLAYSAHEQIPPERIEAVLFYVAEGDDGVEFRFDEVSDRAELESLLAQAEARIAAMTDDAGANDAGVSAASSDA